MQHVVTADDPWLAELAQAFGDLEGKVATADVWKILKLNPYARTMEEQLRLTAVMRLLHGLWHIIEGALQGNGPPRLASGQGRQRLLRRASVPIVTGTNFIFV